MIEPDLRDKIISTATRVEGIEKSQEELKDGQTRIWKAVDDLKDEVQENKTAVAKLNWLPKAMLAIVAAIVGRALWVISTVSGK